jgi:hypothetical protein
MKKSGFGLLPTWPNRNDEASTAKDEADDTVMPSVDEARLVARPANARKTWKEREFDRRALEQRHLHDSSGVQESADVQRRAAGLKPAADAAERVIEMAAAAAETANTLYQHAIAALLPLVTRGQHAKHFYYLRIVGALVADIAGISGAAISLGEIPTNAFVLSLGASIATVLAGFVGKDLRIWREALRRSRPAEELSDDQREFEWLFRDVDSGRRVVKILAVLSVGIAILVALSIFALRDSVDGSLVGLVYGALAAAVALGSCVSSWANADEVADVLSSISIASANAQARLLRIASNSNLKQQIEDEESTASIREEWILRGEAAIEGTRALKYRVLSRNPGAVGHGPAAKAIGLRIREAGDDK